MGRNTKDRASPKRKTAKEVVQRKMVPAAEGSV
jgi:hypothetical protein